MTDLTKGERTKKKLVDATAQLLRRRGYHATGLSSIVDESGAPRGSLYFYFPGGKDELAVAALEASGALWRRRVDEAIRGMTDIGSGIDAIVKLLADDLEASSYDNGCPVATVALESTSPEVHAAVQRHYAQLENDIVERLGRYGVAEGPAKRIAIVALASIEGALLLSKVQRSTAPLATVGAALRAMVSLVSR